MRVISNSLRRQNIGRGKIQGVIGSNLPDLICFSGLLFWGLAGDSVY